MTQKGHEGRDNLVLFRPTSGYTSRASEYFNYDKTDPIIELSGSRDTYANCFSDLIKIQIHNHMGVNIGGHFHLTDYCVLQELLGEELPLESSHLVNKYLNSLGFYKVYLRERMTTPK